MVYKCPVCGKKFQKKSYLAQHVVIHPDEKRYQCSECGRRFKQYPSLSRHKSMHRDEKPYQCTFCDKQFKRQAHLKAHIMIHTDERPYECSDCGKFFRQKASLAQHCLIHSGEKPYRCSICDKRFLKNDTLVKHRVVHTLEEQCQCPICGKRFVYKSSLRKHMQHGRHLKTPSQEKAVSCTNCGAVFHNQIQFGKHCCDDDKKLDMFLFEEIAQYPEYHQDPLENVDGEQIQETKECIVQSENYVSENEEDLNPYHVIVIKEEMSNTIISADL